MGIGSGPWRKRRRSVYTFEKLCIGGFLYVDKTAGIHELIEPAFAQYFLSRPRSFGKSLLVSTLKAIFQGRRDLFEGLALADMDYVWQTYPVIHLDMGSIRSRSKEELESGLLLLVQQCAEDQHCSLSASELARCRFRRRSRGKGGDREAYGIARAASGIEPKGCFRAGLLPYELKRYCQSLIFR